MSAEARSRRKNVDRVLFGALFLGAGVVHFTQAPLFEDLVPNALQGYRASLNTIIGALLFALGLAFMVPQLRALARWGSITLLSAMLLVTHPRTFHPISREVSVIILGVVIVCVLMIVLIWRATNSSRRVPWP